MSDTFAIQHVLNGYRTEYSRRKTLSRAHAADAPRLEADNLINARNAAVAQALIDQIISNASAARSAPTAEVASSPTTGQVLNGGAPRVGKTAGRALLLAALRDAVADITAVEGPEAAAFVHDHTGEDCPACLLTSGGDLAELDAA